MAAVSRMLGSMQPPGPVVHVIAVAHERLGELKVFVQSWINQSAGNWRLTVIHDGPNADFDATMAGYARLDPGRIRFESTPTRFNDWGHSLREQGLRDIRGDWVLLTNADNYFIPKALEILNQAIASVPADVVLFDMVHSHTRPGGRDQPAYTFFQTDYKRLSIDLSAAIVRAELAAQAGFRDKTHDGDATYFEDVMAVAPSDTLRVAKIPQILFVHN